MAEQIERIGETRNDVVTQLQGRRAQGATRYFLGDFVAARALLEQCQGLCEPTHRATAAGLSADPYALMLAQLALTLVPLGYVNQARVRISEALSEARRLRHALTLANVLLRANLFDWFIRTAEAQRRTEELLALSTEHDFPLFLGWATALRGWGLLVDVSVERRSCAPGRDLGACRCKR